VLWDAGSAVKWKGREAEFREQTRGPSLFVGFAFSRRMHVVQRRGERVRGGVVNAGACGGESEIRVGSVRAGGRDAGISPLLRWAVARRNDGY
jgi:hypothetical protein